MWFIFNLLLTQKMKKEREIIYRKNEEVSGEMAHTNTWKLI